MQGSRILTWTAAIGAVAATAIVTPLAMHRVRATAVPVRSAATQAVALLPDGRILVGTGAHLEQRTIAGGKPTVLRASGVRQILVDPGNPAQVTILNTLGKIFRSTDGGRTWHPAPAAGLPPAPARAIAYDPGGPLRLAALVADHGYHQGDLTGRRWQQLGTWDIPGAQAMAISPLDPRTVLVGTTGGLYRSTSQGMRFEHAAARLPWDLPGTVRGLAVAGDRKYMLAVTTRGLFRSTDGGRTWPARPDPDLPDLTAVAVDPRDSNRLVAAGSDGSLALSLDRGRTWHPLP